MTEPRQPASSRSKLSNLFRDLAWVLLFALLAWCQEDLNYSADLVIVFFAIFKIVEPKIPQLAAGRWQLVALMVQMLLAYLLVGWSHGINSYYYVIFLLPIISAATSLDLPATIVVILLACVAYASFLFFIDWNQEYIPSEEWRVFFLRISFFPTVGLLVYELAQARRQEVVRTKQAADELAKSNRILLLTQASLRRSERLAALGQLTAGLAHELRNPLGTIRASAELLNRPGTRQNQDLVEELAGYIGSEVDRTNALVSRFLDFARPLKLQPATTDLAETLRQAAAQAGPRSTERNVRLDLDLPSSPLLFSFDPALLTVAVLNLLQNAIDASAPGSAVQLEARPLENEARIVVCDHGSGISPNHIESIFNPFFTTKSDGTGLGLALVAKIIDEHGGKIQVRSEPGKGTAFEILLPLSLQNATLET